MKKVLISIILTSSVTFVLCYLFLFKSPKINPEVKGASTTVELLPMGNFKPPEISTQPEPQTPQQQANVDAIDKWLEPKPKEEQEKPQIKTPQQTKNQVEAETKPTTVQSEVKISNEQEIFNRQKLEEEARIVRERQEAEMIAIKKQEDEQKALDQQAEQREIQQAEFQRMLDEMKSKLEACFSEIDDYKHEIATIEQKANLDIASLPGSRPGVTAGLVRGMQAKVQERALIEINSLYSKVSFKQIECDRLDRAIKSANY